MLVRFDAPRACYNMMENFFSSDVMPTRTAAPALDVIEFENELVVKAELPGLKKEDVKITFVRNVLTISTEPKPAEEFEKAKILVKEIRSAGFNRSVKFGIDVDSEKISAEMSNGILSITLPKTEDVKAKEISIN
jgi:HSP20 family protein